MIIHKFKQQTPEWFKARDLKATASNATAIGNDGKGLVTYVKKVVAEHYTPDQDKEESFSSKDTRRGIELEPVARSMYELEYGVTVDQVGFIEMNEHVGASPDGLIGEDGGLEIKCIDSNHYIDHIQDGEDAIESGYIWQVQMNLLISGRKWWDIAFYNPNFPKPLSVYRIYPDAEKMEKLTNGIESFISQKEALIAKIESK